VWKEDEEGCASRRGLSCGMRFSSSARSCQQAGSGSLWQACLVSSRQPSSTILKLLFVLAIWSLSPQRFHYHFVLSIVSWQYQKYSTILILVLCLLCVTPLVCSSYSSFASSSPFFSS